MACQNPAQGGGTKYGPPGWKQNGELQMAWTGKIKHGLRKICKT